MSQPAPIRNDAPQEKQKNSAIKAALIGGVFTILAALITSVVAPILVEQARRASGSAGTPQTTGSLAPSADPSAVISAGMSLPIDQCPSVAFPADINPDQNPSEAARQALDAKTRGDTDTWPIIGNNDLILDLTVTSLLRDSGWIKTSNSVKIAITAKSVTSDHTNALLLAWGCGGGGLKRTFSDIDLSTDHESYTLQSTSSEFDFFTLEPGEFEVFSLLFHCKAPGIYSLSLELTYTLSEKPGTVSYRLERPIICPKSFTSWALEGESFLFFNEYIWDGLQYNLKT